MRILHLLSQTVLTGAEVYAKELIEYQVQAGHEVFVISDKFHVPIPVSWQSIPLAKNGFITRYKNILQLRNYLQQHKIEVIHCHSRGAVRHAWVARLKLKIAMVTTIHGQQHSSLSKKIIDHYGDIKILICENLFADMVNKFNIRKQTMRLVRNPFNVDHFPFQTQLIQEKKWAYIGRASGPKGKKIISLFENTIFHVLKNNPNISIDLITPEPKDFGNDFLNKIAGYPQIKILGPFPNLHGVYKNYSLIFGAGRVAVESLLSGIPVYSIGEFASLGQVTTNNFADCLKSQFGDIGHCDIKESEIKPNFEIKEYSQHERRQLRELCQIHFSADNIQFKIINIYKDAIFKVHQPKWIPILMYHKVPDTELQSQHRIFVTKNNLAKHFHFFKAKRFNTLSFFDLAEFWNLNRSYAEFPKKPLILTFDDGYKDNLYNLLPLLIKFQFKATVFILADHQIKENIWDSTTGEPGAQLLDLDEKKILAKNPLIEIGSHGFDHQRLTDISQQNALSQMKKSKEFLENDLNTKVTAFAFPYGSTNAQLPSLCEESGYQFAVNTDSGGMHIFENRFGIFRVNIFPEDGSLELFKKTSTWYRKYFFYKRNR